MYDPSVGRFTSTDVLGFAAGDVNLFRYVGNSPTNATDPSGLEKRVSQVNHSQNLIIKVQRNASAF